MSFFDEVPPLRTKICGITSEVDAHMAIAAGADALGFNLFKSSKRFIVLEENAAWIRALPKTATRIAVVVNATAEELKKIREADCFDAIQFHGDEMPEFCAKAGFPIWIKAIRVKSEGCFPLALTFETPFILFDASVPSQYGGTGTRLDWDMVRDFVVKHPERKYILAGGLTPTNVREAVRIVRPHAVDVSSGVELDPRHKNEYLVREFIDIARHA